MSYLIDDVARILASPMPRRQALRFLSGALASGVLGTFGAKWADAAACPKGTTACGTTCCEKGKACCTSSSKPFCITAGKICCGSTSCDHGQTCCTTSARPFCATAGKTCCGSTSCSKGQTCCNGVCCQAHQVCVKGRCQVSNT